MVAAVTGQASQGFVFSLGEGPSDNVLTAQFFATTIYNFRADEGDVSQGFVTFLAESNPVSYVSQAFATVVYKVRADDPRVRAWTFTLDGHDYYVLRLGEIETLIYDTHSQQWYVWGDQDGDIWKLLCGTNWTSAGTLMNDYGSNVIVGDYANGALYMLDPDYAYDDDRWNEDNEKLFHRFAQGQVIVKNKNFVPCYGVALLASFGEDGTDGMGIQLLYSDDAGRSYVDAGTITIAEGDYAARAEWRSLGSMSSPGRLFRIWDDGAVARLDGLELLENASQ
jgi:hypothetical protein